MWKSKTNALAAMITVIGVLLVFFIAIKYRAHSAETPAAPSAIVQLAKVQLRPMVKTLITYGVVNVSPEQTHQLTLQNEAMVQKVFVTVGQTVKKGQPLVQVAPSAAARLSVENTKLNLAFATKELARLTKLRTQYLATNTEVATAQQNVAKAQAELAGLSKATQSAGGQLIKAGEDNIVMNITAQPGQVIPAGAPLLTYANPTYMQIRLGVESEDLHAIKVGQTVVITPLQNQALNFNGFIQYITGQIDATTGLINVIVTLKDGAALILGSMVKGEIFLETPRNMLTIPRSALLYDQGRPYIFVNNKGKAEQRFVTPGEDNGTFVGIVKGLKLNEQVVTLGNYELQNGMSLHVEQP